MTPQYGSLVFGALGIIAAVAWFIGKAVASHIVAHVIIKRAKDRKAKRHDDEASR